MRAAIQLRYNPRMTIINTIEDLARIVRDPPTWAEVLRALLLTQELLPVSGWLDRFDQTRQGFNQAQQETNQLNDQQPNGIEAVPASRMLGMNLSSSKPLETEVCRVVPPC